MSLNTEASAKKCNGEENQFIISYEQAKTHKWCSSETSVSESYKLFVKNISCPGLKRRNKFERCSFFSEVYKTNNHRTDALYADTNVSFSRELFYYLASKTGTSACVLVWY